VLKRGLPRRVPSSLDDGVNAPETSFFALENWARSSAVSKPLPVALRLTMARRYSLANFLEVVASASERTCFERVSRRGTGGASSRGYAGPIGER